MHGMQHQIPPAHLRFTTARELSALAMCSNVAEEVVTQSFDALALDSWYNVPGAQRFRRFQRFFRKGTEWSYSDDYSFMQSKHYNAVVGDVVRTFEPIASEVMATGLLQSFALQQAEHFRIDIEAYEVAVHQFRVAVAGEHAGSSTPEGVHQDGHEFVCIVHWDSHNITGGTSRVYDLDKKLIYSHALRGRTEALLLDDRMHFHDVSEVLSANGEKGWRDVFVFDWGLKEKE